LIFSALLGNGGEREVRFERPYSRFPERKAIVIFGYEHSPPPIDITVAI
jgi:hypothetical protein